MLKKSNTQMIFRKYWVLYLLALPGLLYFFIYCYIPMGGLIMVFKEYRIARGIFASRWNGIDNFIQLFSAPIFPIIIRNTIVISFYKLAFGFPAPIIIAFLLNELYNIKFKRILQTVLYLPHFVSWVVVGSLINAFFAPETGALSIFLRSTLDIRLNLLMDPGGFVGLLVGSDIWKEVGLGSIIYLAAITGIDTDIFEAATVDGANKFQQSFRITLPCILPTIMTMLLLRLGRILNAGFEQIFVLQNRLVYTATEILDTYVYGRFLDGQYAIGAASGLFKAIIGLILVLVTNKIAQKFEQGVL